MIAYAIHDIGPYIWHFGGRMGLRWYGLSYLMAFVCGYWILRFLSRRDLWVVRPDRVVDFVTYAALFGVLLGGRLGYMLFYNSREFFADPFILVTGLLRCEGGMASHGGILGLFLFTLWYAWRSRLNWAAVGDGLVVAAPLGICFVRLANFINGELWGRKTSVPWAWIFPAELNEGGREAERAQVVAELGLEPGVDGETLLSAIRDRVPEDSGVVALLESVLDPRHPSQLYQAAVEGLLLFLVLLAVRLVWRKNLPPGILTGLFFLGYAAARVWIEQYREPDAGIDGILGLTRGQSLSLGMIPVGLAFLAYGVWSGRRERTAVEGGA